MNRPFLKWRQTRIHDVTWSLIGSRKTTSELNSMYISFLRVWRHYEKGLLLNLGQAYKPVKPLAWVVGQIISLQTAAGNIVQLMTRSAYSLINSWNNSHEKNSLDSATKTELLFWRKNITVLNSKVIWDDNTIPSVMVYSDASAYACGAFVC